MRRCRLDRGQRKKRRSIIIFSMTGIVCFFSVGYAAFSSNFLVSGKGTIIENPITIDELKAKKVTEGNGLYIDEYEDNRYVYRGEKPNNYLKIENDMWRILSIESDNKIKIIKNESLGKKYWDSGVGVWGYNNWKRPAVINTYLNNDYYNSLSQEFQNLIERHTWNVGAVTHGNSDLVNQLNEEKSITWEGNIGLISVSDYIKANSNLTQCGYYAINNQNWEICKNTNYLIKEERFWTITAYDIIIIDNSTVVYNINNSGGISAESAGYAAYDSYPSLYLNENIKLSGKGTENNPYTIAL